MALSSAIGLSSMFEEKSVLALILVCNAMSQCFVEEIFDEDLNEAVLSQDHTENSEAIIKEDLMEDDNEDNDESHKNDEESSSSEDEVYESANDHVTKLNEHDISREDIRLAIATLEIILFRVDGTNNCANSLTKPLNRSQLALESEIYQVEIEP
jgi:hypothetical protein